VQGYPKLTGFAWYRLEVILASHAGPLALWDSNPVWWTDGQGVGEISFTLIGRNM
jgi:hypothetical protein